jgi:hypothetical protein
MLVSNTLLVASHTLNGKHSIFLTQEAGIELTVRNNPKEDESNADGQASSNQEYDFPGFNTRSMETRTLCDAISHQTTEDLCESIEREPDTGAGTLLFLGVPLRRQKCESRCYSRFSDFECNQLADTIYPELSIHTSEHEAYSDSASKILYRSKSAQGHPPQDDVDRRIFSQW